MNRKDVIRSLLEVITFELLQFIRESESSFHEGWVPAAHIKEQLSLNFAAVLVENRQYGEKGGFSRPLRECWEEQKLVEHKKVGSRVLYRSLSKSFGAET